MAERYLHKLHEKQYEEDTFYKERADCAKRYGLPFCPLEKGTVHSISCKCQQYCELKGLCSGCFLDKIYHEVMFVSGESYDNRPLVSVYGKIQHKKYFKDDGRTKKEQVKRMKDKSGKIKLFERPFIIGGPGYDLMRVNYIHI